MRRHNFKNIIPKKICFVAMVFLLLIGTFSGATKVFAQAEGVAETTQSQAQELQSLGIDTPTPSSNAVVNPNASDQSSSTTEGPTDLQCSLGNFSICLSQIVYFIAVAIPTFFLNVATIFFSMAVKLSLDSGAYALSFLSLGWAVSRDVANMAFLFILIYIAFTIMFKAETSGTLSTLAIVIVMALIVNFSFFATRVVIDGGNILGVQIYNAIPAPPGGSTACGGTSTSGECVTKGGPLDLIKARDLSASIMGALNIQTVFSNDAFKNWYQSNQNGVLTNLITLSALFISVGVLIVILAFAFIIAGVNFLGRIVVLWMCIILAPFAWVSQALPGKKYNYLGRWWDALIKNTIYPAVFLFVYLFIALVANAMAQNGSILNSIFRNLPRGTAASIWSFDYLTSLGMAIAVIAIELGIIVYMLRFTWNISEGMGLQSAHFARNMADKAWNHYSDVMKFHGRVGFALARFGAGAAASKGAETLEKSKWANRPGPLGWVGYRTRKNVLEPMAHSKAGGGWSYDEFKEGGEKRRKEQASTLYNIQKNEALDTYKELSDKEALLKNQTETRIKPPEVLPENIERHDSLKLKSVLSGLDRDEETEFEELKRKMRAKQRFDELQLKASISGLTHGEQEEFKQLKGRMEGVVEKVTKTLPAAEQQEKSRVEALAKEADTKALELRTAKEIAEVVHVLTKKQMDDVMKSNKFTQTEKNHLEELWNLRGTRSNPFMDHYGSSDNTLNKFDKVVDELHSLAKETKIGVKLQKGNSKDMKETIKRERELIDSKRIAAQREHDAARDEWRVKKNSADGKERADAREKYDNTLRVLDNHRKMLDKLNDLEKARTDVPQHKNEERGGKEYAAGDIEVRKDKENSPI